MPPTRSSSNASASASRNHVVVSARTGARHRRTAARRSARPSRGPDVALEVLIPYDRGDVVSRLHSEDAEILATEHLEEGTRLMVKVREGLAADLEPFSLHG